MATVRRVLERLTTRPVQQTTSEKPQCWQEMGPIAGPGVTQKEGGCCGLELAASGERVVLTVDGIVGHDHVVQDLDAEQRATGN